MNLNDAQKMGKEFPKFEAPTREVLGSIKVGDCVQVSNNYDRFWVKLTTVEGETLIGTIDNKLVGPLGKYGDVLMFEKRHVYNLATKP